jgi:hypothetical protein
MSVLTICALLALPSVVHAAPADFTGHWLGVDVDESNVRITITGPTFGPFDITWTDSYWSYCDGGPGIIRGTGTLTSPFLMDADLVVDCLATGESESLHVTFEHQPPIDTLFVDYGDDWDPFECHRPGQVPIPSAATIIASAEGDWLWTADFTGGATLDISIYESDHPDAELRWTGTKTANQWGFVHVLPTDTGDLDFLVGNYVTVCDSFVEKGLVLEWITWDTFDADNDFAAGTAPPGRDVLVVVANGADPADQRCLHVVADRDGNWTADFSAIVDFQDTSAWRGYSFASIFDKDGDTNEAGPPPGS